MLLGCGVSPVRTFNHATSLRSLGRFSFAYQQCPRVSLNGIRSSTMIVDHQMATIEMVHSYSEMSTGIIAKNMAQSADSTGTNILLSGWLPAATLISDA